MQYRIFKFLIAGFFLGIFLNGCGSTKETVRFESILYPEGRPVTIKLKDDYADRRFDFYFLEASRFKMTGDFGNAAVYYTEALKIDSTCATCYFEIGNLLVQNKEFESAETYVFKSVQYDPTNEYFIYLLSKLYANNEKLGLALLSADYLSNQHPDEVEYLFHLAQLQAHNGNFESAIQTMNKIESLVGINENLIIEKHSLHLENGDVKGAENEFIRLIETYPNNSEYLVFLGDFYIQQEDFKKALSLYNRVISEDPGNGHVYFSLANYYYHNEDIELFKANLYEGFSHPNVDLDSKVQRILPFLMGMDETNNPVTKEDLNRFLEQIITIHPYEASIHVLNGNFQKQIENDSLALISYETALLIDEQQEDIWHEYLLLLFSEEHSTKFLSESSKAVKLYPDNGVFNYLSAFANMMNDLDDEAIRFFNVSIEKSPENDDLKSQVYGLLGDLYYRSGELEKSFESYEKSLEIKNDNVVVLNNYAYYLSLAELNLDKAEEMISTVVQLEPSNPTYLDTYAWVLFVRGKFIEALFIIEQAIDNGGDGMGVVLEHYGDILYKVGNKQEALKYWKLALDSDDEISTVLPEKIKLEKYIPEN